jgi:hypothetical protein
MTTTLDDVTARKKKAEPTPEEAAALELVRRVREQGLSLTGPDGLLRQLTKTVLETALNEELTEVRQLTNYLDARRRRARHHEHRPGEREVGGPAGFLPGPAHPQGGPSAREWQQAQHTASEVVAPGVATWEAFRRPPLSGRTGEQPSRAR